MAYCAYAVEANVRRLTRTVFEEVVIGSAPQVSGSTIRIQRKAKSIASVVKNGVTLTPVTDYSFAEPYTLTLVVAPVASDVFLIIAYTDVTTAEVNTAIYKGSAEANAFFNQQYTVPFVVDGNSLYPLQVVQIAEWLAAYYLGQIMYTTEQPNQSMMLSEYKRLANELMQKVWRNEAQLTCSDGTVVSRKEGPV